MAITHPVERVVERIGVESFYRTCLRALIHIRVGSDNEVIRDTGGVVYVGRLG